MITNLCNKFVEAQLINDVKFPSQNEMELDFVDSKETFPKGVRNYTNSRKKKSDSKVQRNGRKGFKNKYSLY